MKGRHAKRSDLADMTNSINDLSEVIA
ncbi:MAG: hypothetical protein ACLSDG_02625 [Streptococcus thermophilus]